MSDRALFEAVTEADWQRLCKEFDTTKQRVDEDVVLLKQWLTQQPHLPQNIQGGPLIQTMLIRCKMSLKQTKESLDSIFTIKSKHSEFFSNRDPMSDEMQSVMNLVHIGLIPQLTKEGDRIIILRFSSADASSIYKDSITKLISMICDVVISKHEELGIRDVLIYDLKHLSMSHVSQFSLSRLKTKEEDGFDNMYRGRAKAYQIVNAPSFIGVLMSMAKLVLKSKLVSRIHIHDTLESLHQHVDPELLPAELGGSYKTLTELAGDWRKELESHRDWFLEEEVLQRVDESKRPGGSVDSSALFDMEGTFRTLTVD